MKKAIDTIYAIVGTALILTMVALTIYGITSGHLPL